MLKGYLNITITSQTVSSEAQVKNFFILSKSQVSFSRYSGFCIFNHATDLPNLWCHDEY